MGNVSTIYTINTILANKMKENPEENNKEAVEIKGVFFKCTSSFRF